MLIVDAAAQIGVHRDTIYGRLKSGWSAHHALQTPPQHVPRLTWQGRTLSVFQWANETGMKPPTLYNRLKRGWTVEQTLTTPARRPATSAGH
jgi:predicted DNA-binding transcriptional regulator AlpA